MLLAAVELFIIYLIKVSIFLQAYILLSVYTVSIKLSPFIQINIEKHNLNSII